MSTSRKIILTPKILKPYGITIDSTVVHGHDLESLPSHIRIVQEGLLDFEEFVTREALADIHHVHNEIPATAYRYSRNLEKWEEEKLREFINMAEKIWSDAQILQCDSSSEAKWQDLFNQTVFKQRKVPLAFR